MVRWSQLHVVLKEQTHSLFLHSLDLHFIQLGDLRSLRFRITRLVVILLSLDRFGLFVLLTIIGLILISFTVEGLWD